MNDNRHISSSVEWDDLRHYRFERTLPPGPPLRVDPPINWWSVLAYCAGAVALAGGIAVWVLP